MKCTNYINVGELTLLLVLYLELCGQFANASRSKNRRVQTKESTMKRYTCYTCNSVDDAGCGKDFNETATKTTLCDHGAVCNRITIYDYNDTVGDYYWRGCTGADINEKLNSCTFGNVTSADVVVRLPPGNATSFALSQRTCKCNRHYCNESPPFHGHTGATLLMLLMSVAAAAAAPVLFINLPTSTDCKIPAT